MALKLTSRAFGLNGTIPEKHSKDGGNISPPLEWTGVPEDTTSLTLIMDDPDAPAGLFTHWIVYGIDRRTTELSEHLPQTVQLPNGARQGMNGFGEIGYGGPKPPSGTHRYFLHLYALDTDTDMPPGLTRQEIDGAIHGHVIAEIAIMAYYQHKEKTRAAR